MASLVLVVFFKRSKVGSMGRRLESRSAEDNNLVVVKRGTLENRKGS